MIEQLIADGDQGGNRRQIYFRRRLGEFTQKTHSFGDKPNVTCRENFAPFYNELGNIFQSIIGFLQLTSADDEIFMEKLVTEKLGFIRGNPDILLRLQNICPVLHSVYSSLQDDNEESLFSKVTKGLYNLYQNAFKSGSQWWEQEQVTSAQGHEQYIVSGMEKVRDLPRYAGGSDLRSCKKVPYSTNNLTGTFFAACNHGFYIASLLMQVNEIHSSK